MEKFEFEMNYVTSILTKYGIQNLYLTEELTEERAEIVSRYSNFPRKGTQVYLYVPESYGKKKLTSVYENRTKKLSIEK